MFRNQSLTVWWKKLPISNKYSIEIATLNQGHLFSDLSWTYLLFELPGQTIDQTLNCFNPKYLHQIVEILEFESIRWNFTCGVGGGGGDLGGWAP